MGYGVIFLTCWVGAAVRWTLGGSTYIMGGTEESVAAATSDGLAARGSWRRLWELLGVEQIVVSVVVLAVLVAVAYYIVGKTRPKPVQKERKASEWLSKCRELHSQGELSDEEFRTIKTNLAAQLQAELNDNDEKG
jgi:uncharacterized membrane protein